MSKFSDKDFKEIVIANTEVDWQTDNILKALEAHDKKVIQGFASWLSKNDLLNASEIDYDYEDNVFQRIYSLSAEEVLEMFKEDLEYDSKQTDY